MAALPSIKQLNYLVAIADNLNFTRAAEACFVSQSTLSSGLKELEETLGVRLVERDRQNVLITPIGLETVTRAKAIVIATHDLTECASGSQEPMVGLIRLGLIPTVAPFLLPRAMRLLRTRYHDLQLALREDLTADLLSRLADGRLDFALIALPYDTGNFQVRRLFDDPLWLVSRDDDREVATDTVRLSSKITQRLLLLEEGHCLRDHTMVACPAPNYQSGSEVEATSLLTLMEMVEYGLGFALIPEMAIRRDIIANRELTARRIVKPVPKRIIALVARRSTPRIETFTLLADAVIAAHQALDGGEN